jgi:putative transposase
LVCHHGLPEKTTIDKSRINTAAIENYNAEENTDIEIRQTTSWSRTIIAP